MPFKRKRRGNFTPRPDRTRAARGGGPEPLAGARTNLGARMFHVWESRLTPLPKPLLASCLIPRHFQQS